MTLSREEIAVRLACADVQGSSLPPDKDRAVWAAQVVATTDAIGAALTHTPAPVAPPAGKYVPKVGDVVVVSDRKISGHPTGAILRLDRLLSDDDPLRWRATTLMEPAGGPFWRGTVCLINTDEVRPATPSELAAAGLAVPPPAPTPAPEAKRPTHVRVTRLAHSDRPATVGKVYEVVRWNYDGSPDVIGDNGSNMSLSKPDGSDEKVWPAWEPAHCPPPVAGRGDALPEDVRELLLDVEHAAKWANQPQGPAVEYVRGRLKELAARAHDILTPPVRP